MQVAPAVSQPRFLHLAATDSEVGELVIDCEEDRLLRPVLVGMLRDAERVSDRGRR
jgi:hypothetical protein